MKIWLRFFHVDVLKVCMFNLYNTNDIAQFFNHPLLGKSAFFLFSMHSVFQFYCVPDWVGHRLKILQYWKIWPSVYRCMWQTSEPLVVNNVRFSFVSHPVGTSSDLNVAQILSLVPYSVGCLCNRQPKLKKKKTVECLFLHRTQIWQLALCLL